MALACARLGATDTAFRPPGRERRAIPATERDAWRGRVRGSVHDEKAHLMCGVAGHAGLFGTALDVARLAELFLAPATGRAPTTLERTSLAPRLQSGDRIPCSGAGWAGR